MNTTKAVRDIDIIEVEAGIRTCQCKDCKTGARWKVKGFYYCNRHFYAIFTVVYN